MNSTITISVIIPCYNSEKTIEICLKSILSQSEPVDEIIIVDDGSSDYSVMIINETLKKANVKFKLFEQKNQGPSVARNKAVSLAECSHIAFIDSDDEWGLDHILIVKQFLEENSEYKIVATKKLGDPNKFSGEILFKKLVLKNYLPTSSVVLDKDCFWKFDGFNEEMRYSEDYYLWLKIVFKNKAYLLNYLGAKSIECKRIFGDKGLSSNLFAMHKGVLECYYELYKKERIDFKKYIFLKNFEKLKYLRRKILTYLYK